MSKKIRFLRSLETPKLVITGDTSSSSGCVRNIWLGQQIPDNSVGQNGDIYIVYEADVTVCDHEYTATTTDPTCTSPGSTVYVCSLCNNTYTTTIAALGHEWGSWITDEEATEYDNGSKHRVCSTCNAEETATIPATGHTTHTPGNAVRENEIAATCTTPGSYDLVTRCTGCDAILTSEAKTIAATGHDWDEWIVDKEATETAEGSRHRECANCDEVETETIPKTDHVHVEGEAKEENRVAATCETDGKYDLVVRCTGCGNIISSETITIPATGHTNGDAVVENRIEATCTTEGSYDTVVYCTTCGTERSRVAHEIPVIAHTPGAAATCTTAQVCTVCQTVLKAATGHTEVIDEAVEATCTSTGLTVGKHCSVCNTVLIAQQTVPEKEHTEEIIPGVTATCKDAGLTEGKRCSVCKVTLVAQQTIPTSTVPHTYDDKYDAVCNVCGYVRDAECAHLDTEPIVGKPATCTESGLTDGTRCKTCGDILVSQEIIKATGHNYESEITAPTCTDGGYTTYTCHCGDSYIGDYTEILGHSIDEGSPDSVDRIEPTCTTSGSETRYYTCDRCNEPVVKEEILSATGHTDEFENGEVCECTKCGAVDHYYDPSASPDGEDAECFCSRCDSVVHTWSEAIDTVEATCTQPGGYHRQCTRCDTTEFVQTSGTLEHDFSEPISDRVAPTCTKVGYEAIYECSHCTTRAGGEEIPKLEHEYDESAPEEDICLCILCGEYIHNTEGENCECIDCGAHVYIDTNGDYRCDICGESICEEHDWVTSEEAQDPTCTEPGYTLSEYCGNCGERRGGEVVGEPLGHAFNSESKCDRCGYICTDHLEGESVIENSYEPSCTKKGSYDTVWYCQYCGIELQRTTTEVDMVAHTRGEGVSEVTVEPGCETWGEVDTVIYCSVCDTELERYKDGVLEPLGHEYTTGTCVCQREGCGEEVHCGPYSQCICVQCSKTVHQGNEVPLGYLAPDCVNGIDGHEADGTCCDLCYETIKKPTVIPGEHILDSETCECQRCGNIYHDIPNDDDCHCMNCGRDRLCDYYSDFTEATCTQGKTCNRCGTVWSSPLDHSWIDATCDQPKTCSVCNTTEGSALGHDWGDWEIWIDSSCDEMDMPGERRRWCQNCNEEDVDDDYRPDHDWQDATCTEPKTCSVCGATEGTKLGHDWENDPQSTDSICTRCPEVCSHDNYDEEADGETCPDCGKAYPYEQVEPDACLIASTPILMADGSEKAISQVRAGDMVKSWDIENNDYIDVKVLGAYCTGTEQDWLVHTFDNGKSLDISNEHRIFCKEKNSVRQSTDWRAGNTAIALDGAETKYCDVETRHDDSATRRYTMLTENNLYFANGILCGHHAKAKYKFFTKGLLEATLEEAVQYRVTAALYDELDKAFTNEEYLKQAAPLREQLLKAKSDIRAHRHEISKLDRDIKKRGRAKIAKKELTELDGNRNNRVMDAKRMKADSKALRQELDSLKQKFGITTKSKYQIWKEAYDLDMKYVKEKAAE